MKKLQYLAKTALSVMALSTVLFLSSCKDECKDVDCQNGGTCVEGTCECASGYEGSECQTQWRDKVVKVWNVTSNSCAGVGGWQVTVTEGSGSTGLNLGNFSHLTCLGGGITVNANMTGSNTFEIPSQQLCDGNITISGSGTISGNALNISYTYNIPGENGTCTEVYN